ncbi:MAG: xanthine dehydrogenase [Bacteroidetes bacterium HGW-Bacteroidetes-16]|jgi:xanthine dehydrogenase accessory factor|nr:MAG: xanthine dehydrogenase [Bacteroidetes bacterium HGW-Bacteroidetes-16]
MSNKEFNTWKFISEKLSRGLHCYLMVIVESNGSSPGRKGFKMAVSQDQELVGSVGGGSMEHRLVEECKMLLQQPENHVFLRKEIHHDNSASPSGMICSGNQTIAFFPLMVQHLELVQNILSAIENKEPCSLIYHQEGILLQNQPTDYQHKRSGLSTDENWVFTEMPGYRHHVFIVGGGHVGLALSRILLILDFQITIFDEREHVNTFEDNVFAHEKKRINYNEAGQHIPEGSNIMVVIMTQFHTSDSIVLKQLIGKKLGYLGMMGSKAKVNTIFRQLENEGISRELLQRVHSPIGIEILSQTPEEIAISIAAELIAVKNSVA